MKERLICLLIGYGVGCIQTAWMISVLHFRKDIRNYGSGNAGTTNMARVFGAGSGVITLILDISKGVLAVCIAGWIYGFGFANTNLRLWAGVGVVLGHNFPFYLKFRGGKGFASSIGVWIAIDFRVFLIAAIPSLIVLFGLQYMSVTALTAMTVAFITTCFLYVGKIHGTEVILLSAFFMVMSFIRHKDNIKRLIQGKENKITFAKTKKSESKER